MARNDGLNIKITTPGTAFQQICNYVAIAETRNPAESLRELVLHMLHTFEDEKASTVQDVSEILKTVFGVDAPDHQIQESLDQLISDGQVHQPVGTNYALTTNARTKVKARIDQAFELQELVRMQWLGEMVGRFPDLNADLAWAALQDYIAKAFLRHGIQVAVFLDPSVELPKEYAASLSGLLVDAVQSNFDSTRQESAIRAISEFLANVGKYPERVQFIAECADGAANYFSLAISPEVAGQFREKLSSLMLFCDTNFLFGILDLHVHPLVEVSNHLLEAIDQHKLPLTLRYHETTLQELLTAISHYADILHRNMWSRALSRAATTSHLMSGVELKYHQKNAESGIDVDTFLRPYQHVDVLLKERKIDIYRPPTDRLTERATLEAEYKDFLTRLRKEKPHELIAHDVTVLDCVRSLRNSAKSTLEAGALFVTCDYTLYRFDSEASQIAKTQASVVLPNVLWQVLRPFIPTNQDFDRSFAETFAIPEFRTIGSGAAKACSRMLGLLAAYKDFPEETAVRLLSNDLLMDQLRVAENDGQFQAQVDSAIASENQTLLEERAAMAKQIDALKADKERAEREAEEQKHEAAAEFKAHEKVKETLREREERLRATAAEKMVVDEKIAKLEKIQADRETTERKKSLLRSARVRVAVMFVLFLVTEIGIGWAIWNGLKGQNSIQKILEAWPVWTSIFAGFSFITYVVLGKERAKALMWWKG